jgi:hypothetical protein
LIVAEIADGLVRSVEAFVKASTVDRIVYTSVQPANHGTLPWTEAAGDRRCLLLASQTSCQGLGRSDIEVQLALKHSLLSSDEGGCCYCGDLPPCRCSGAEHRAARREGSSDPLTELSSVCVQNIVDRLDPIERLFGSRVRRWPVSPFAGDLGEKFAFSLRDLLGLEQSVLTSLARGIPNQKR